MDIFQCTQCDKSFYKKRYLSAHAIRVHKARTAREFGNQVKCIYCEKVFNSKNSESKHRIRVHGKNYDQFKIECQEDGCSQKCENLRMLRRHLKDIHSYENLDECESKTFKSHEDYAYWLANEERNNKCNFMRLRGKSKQGVSYYHCSRSGCYRTTSRGKRQLKAQGTKRTGYNCTAEIVLKEYENHVDVKYYMKHYKHDFLLSHIPLPQEIKQTVAGKLLQGVNSTRILRDIRGSLDDGREEQRHHLITRKDINNIKKDFGTDMSNNPFLFDEIGVQAWVEKMKTEGNLILDFKEQNSSHESLESNDFFLAFMMPIQIQMLLDFGADRICVDSTHGTTGYGFELVTIMVIDEFEEGFPVAFCLSSTVSFHTMKHFFKKVKEATNPKEMKTKVFMSDDAPFFYQAWESIFGPVEAQLLCAWHIDRAWQGHLNSIPPDKRTNIYKTLKSITYELNIETFNDTLVKFMTELKNDPDTQDFYNYFFKYYSQRTHMWAYCYRKGAKLNTNMHLEHFHREIKHIYLDGKKCKRVDKCCESLKNYINDKKFERLIKLHKGKITKKHTGSHKRHREGKKITSNCIQVSEGKWSVKSETFSSINYIVKKIHTCLSICNLMCRECVCCLSVYECTCHDFSILNNMCKHIHAVNLASKNETYFGPLLATPTNLISKTTNINKPTDAPVTTKDCILNKLNTLYTKTLTKTSIDPVVAKQILNTLNSVENLLNIDTIQHTDQNITSSSKEPANKKIVPQKRFFSTKKQRAKKPKLNKPSREEQLNATNALLNKSYISINPQNDHAYIKFN